MFIIKPQSLGVLTRPMEYRKRFGLCVSGYLHVPFEQKDSASLWGEQSMWKFLTSEMKTPLIDEGIAKLSSEFLVHGYAYADEQHPGAVAVRARLGNSEKTILAFGERYWDGNRASAPAPFERIPLDWAHAYGGEGFAPNLQGKGRKTVDGVRWLPNLEVPSSRIRTPDEVVVPAGFSALDVMHPQRAALRGTYDETWMEEHSPGFAPDLQWKHFNLAPRDQWIDPILNGDEAYALENLHPTRKLIEGRLPGLRTRMFANYKVPGSPKHDPRYKMRELSMRLTTVWFFPHAERMILIFQGVAESTQDDGSDIAHLLGAVETLDPASRRPDSHYLEVLGKRTVMGPAAALEALNDSDLVTPGIDLFDPAAAAQEAALKPAGLQADAQYARAATDVELAREQLRTRGQDPDKLGVVMPPKEKAPTPAEMPAYLEKLRKQMEVEPWARLEAVVTQTERALEQIARAKVPLATLVHRGPPKLKTKPQLAEIDAAMRRNDLTYDRVEIGTRLQMADLIAQKDYQQSAHMQLPAPPLTGDEAAAARAEVEWLLDNGHRQLVGIDLTGADLSNLDLRHIDFTGAWLESVNFQNSNLSHSNFQGAVLAHAKMRGTVAIRCDFSRANLGAADLEDAVLDQSDFTGTLLMRTRLTRPDLRGATLVGAVLLESKWQKTDCTGAVAKGLFFHKLDLADAVFTGAQLQGAQFVECDLNGADFQSANLESACFTSCKLGKARFGSAQMKGAVFAGDSALTAIDFTDAVLNGANFGGGDLSGSRFIRARLDGSNFALATLTGCDLRLASAKGALLRKADLRSAKLAGVDFKDAILQYADLRGADMRSSHFFGADLTRVRLNGDSRIDGAVLERARILPRHREPEGTGT